MSFQLSSRLLALTNSKFVLQMKYAADDSTTFWAIGPDSRVIAKHADFCGKEVEMDIPFEGAHCGEVKS